MLGVCLLTASWCIFLPWTTGGDTLESTLPGLIRGALLFFGVWAWGGCALLRCPCGLGRRHLLCVFCCICPWYATDTSTFMFASNVRIKMV